MTTRNPWRMIALISLCVANVLTPIFDSPAQVPSPIPSFTFRAAAAQFVPGVSLLLYVSSADRSHFENVLKRAIYLRDTDPRVRLTAVFYVGDSGNVSMEIEEALRKRAIHFAQIGGIPQAIGASTSPTWLIRGPLSDHIVEGPIPIEDCFDDVGAYREPKAQQATKVPLPTPGVKEF